MDDQLLREFLAEAEDLIEVLFGDIQILRARHTEGRTRRELVGRIFRHVHTIKGSAAAAGIEATGEIAHEFETLLDGVRMGRVVVDVPVLEAFDEAVTAIAQSLSAVARGEQPVVPQTLIERLRRFTFASSGSASSGIPQPTEASTAAAHALSALPEEATRALSEYERHRLHEAIREGADVFAITVDFDLVTFDEQFRNLSDTLAEGGEVISTLPGMEASAPDRVNFCIIYATEESRAALGDRLTPFGATLIEAEARATPDAATPIAEEEETEDAGGDGEGGGSPAMALPSAASLTMLVRVPLDELDDLISTTHELFTDTVTTLDLALTQELGRAERIEMEIRAARIRRRFFELEERLIELRMVPVGQTLERAARAGMGAARMSGREVDFETTGGEVRLDKSLADAIADPLLHLLRNAVDHGIELPGERRRVSKSERGRVRIEAVAEGSRVMLRVTDDGRGIDPARVARAAAEQGLIEPDARLTEQQCLRLIFRPGFSTAAAVSAVSGRGVGLDVVERAVEGIGGDLRVWSRPGAGATFEMRLPTTLALVPSLVVHSASDRYCIDASHIIEAGYITRSDIEQIGDAAVVRWRGLVVPLIQMRELLAQPPRETLEERLHIVISRIAGRETEEEEGRALERAAVAIDGWDGHREVLVRGLGRHTTRWRGISGATELSDGRIALMLDLPRLLEMHL